MLLFEHFVFKCILFLKLFHITRVYLVLPLLFEYETFRSSCNSYVMKFSCGTNFLNGGTGNIHSGSKILIFLISLLSMYFQSFHACEAGRSIIEGLPHWLLSFTLSELLRIFFQDHISFDIKQSNSFLQQTFGYLRDISVDLLLLL